SRHPRHGQEALETEPDAVRGVLALQVGPDRRPDGLGRLRRLPGDQVLLSAPRSFEAEPPAPPALLSDRAERARPRPRRDAPQQAEAPADLHLLPAGLRRRI